MTLSPNPPVRAPLCVPCACLTGDGSCGSSAAVKWYTKLSKRTPPIEGSSWIALGRKSRVGSQR